MMGGIFLDMDRVSSSGALDSLHACYKVVLKTFNDNCVRHLILGLEDIFNKAAG
jgi:hypothetical protein